MVWPGVDWKLHGAVNRGQGEGGTEACHTPVCAMNKHSPILAVLALAACSNPSPVTPPPAALPATNGLGWRAQQELERCMVHELVEKDLGSLSMVVVSGSTVIWSAATGTLDPEAEQAPPATSSTVYRVGSVTKLFTDILVMRLVEEGVIDLDTPVASVLPGFGPENPFGGQITLGQLASHRAGLVREPPVGHYFDVEEPSLEETVASLNNTTLVAQPGTVTKYSNAGLAVLGRVVEVLEGRPFDEVLETEVLAPLGLAPADQGGPAMTLTPELEGRLARGTMWTYDGREFPAPTFDLGMAPAGNLYASMEDLAHLVPLVTGSDSPPGHVLSPGSIERMLQPTLDTSGKPTRFGIGFALGELDGLRRCGHGGAVYGHSTELAILPDANLGVAVACSTDVSNAVVRRLADHALRVALADLDGRPVPRLSLGGDVDPLLLKRLPGRYRAEDGEVVRAYGKGTSLVLEYRGMQREVRSHDSGLLIDDRHSFGSRMIPMTGVGFELDGKRFRRMIDSRPDPCPELWSERLGEYGWDHNELLIRERDGKLEALIEWFWFDELTEILPDVYAFPEDRGLYPLERLHFLRDSNGKVEAASLGGVVFPRRPSPEDGEFRIEPIAPIEELREKALASSIPEGISPQRTEETAPLVDLETVIPGLALDVRYAGEDNFLGTPVYRTPRVFLREPAALALARVQDSLRIHGLELAIYDAYRPWNVTKIFYDATPEHMKHFVADPSSGSRHNRGCAVDVTLIESVSRRPVHMPSGFDEFTHRAYPAYPGGTSLQRWYRDLLRNEMRAAGYEVFRWEWWHFDFTGWREFPLENLTFDELGD